MRAILMLEDGRSFPGQAQGAEGARFGEVILNTAVVGYQEMMTDPANAGKILVLTYPLIGNYGCAPKFNESKKARLSGLVIKDNSQLVSNWQARGSLDDFLTEQKLLMIKGIDTRTLTVHLRQHGEMLGVISTQIFEPKALLKKIQEFSQKDRESVLPEISVKAPLTQGKKGKTKKIAVLDLGITNSLLRQMEILGWAITILPYTTLAQEVLRLRPSGLIISGGPENDPGLKEVVERVKPLIAKLPILGISTGHQVLALALGAKLNKMKLGHHGVNYPLSYPGSYKGEISVQNHSYVVEKNSLEKIKNLKITGYNLNDNTVEAIESKKYRLMGVQYYPQSPGLDEVNGVFKRFEKMIDI